MAEIDKVLDALKVGEKIMQGGQRAVRIGAIAAGRIRQKLCAACGEEPTMEGSPIGAACAKRAADSLIDLLK